MQNSLGDMHFNVNTLAPSPDVIILLLKDKLFKHILGLNTLSVNINAQKMLGRKLQISVRSMLKKLSLRSKVLL